MLQTFYLDISKFWYLFSWRYANWSNSTSSNNEVNIWTKDKKILIGGSKQNQGPKT